MTGHFRRKTENNIKLLEPMAIQDHCIRDVVDDCFSVKKGGVGECELHSSRGWSDLVQFLFLFGDGCLFFDVRFYEKKLQSSIFSDPTSARTGIFRVGLLEGRIMVHSAPCPRFNVLKACPP